MTRRIALAAILALLGLAIPFLLRGRAPSAMVTIRGNAAGAVSEQSESVKRLSFLILSRFLNANRAPLRLKTL